MKSSRRAAAILASVLLATPQRIPAQAQADCSGQIDALQRDLRAFDDVARQMGPGFPRADALEAYLGAQRQGLVGDLLNRLTTWNERIKRFADGVAGYRRCLADGGCDINEYVNRQDIDNKEAADWLRRVGDDGLAKATDTTDRAAGPLRDYEAGSGGRAGSSIAKALACVTANAQAPARQAPPNAAPPGRMPPPLPPDTVNQAGLQWNLQIGPCTTGKNPFRFSLCEGRYLTAGEVSRPCSPSLVSGVTGGHNARYAFSAGHGQSLPRGLSVDGNGILQGNSCDLLQTGTNLPLCVRQLHVERCGTFPVDQGTSSSAAVKKGGAAKNAILLVAATAAIAGVAIAATEAVAAAEGTSGGGGGNTGGSGLCTTTSQCARVGSGCSGGSANVRCANDGLCHCCYDVNGRCQACSATSPCIDRNTSCITGVCVFNQGVRP